MILSERKFPIKKLLIGVIFLMVIGVIGFLVTQKPAFKETDIFIPIESDVTSQSITVIVPRSTGLDVRVRGPAEAIAGLSREPLRYQLGIAEAKNGVQKIGVDSSKIGLPADVSIVHIHPRTITVRIERLIEKIFPVETVLTGTPALRFAVANTAIHPESVRVKGAESVVSALTRIRMKPGFRTFGPGRAAWPWPVFQPCNMTRQVPAVDNEMRTAYDSKRVDVLCYEEKR